MDSVWVCGQAFTYGPRWPKKYGHDWGGNTFSGAARLGMWTGDVVKMFTTRVVGLGIEHDGLRGPNRVNSRAHHQYPFRSKSAVTTASAYWSFATICCPTSPVLMALMRGWRRILAELGCASTIGYMEWIPAKCWSNGLTQLKPTSNRSTASSATYSFASNVRASL